MAWQASQWDLTSRSVPSSEEGERSDVRVAQILVSEGPIISWLQVDQAFMCCTSVCFYLLDNFIKVRVRSPRLGVSNAYLQELISQHRFSSGTLCIGCVWRRDAVMKNCSFKWQSIPSLQFCNCMQNELQLRDSASNQETKAMKGFPARMSWQIFGVADFFCGMVCILNWDQMGVFDLLGFLLLLVLCHVLPLPLTSSNSVLGTD